MSRASEIRRWAGLAMILFLIALRIADMHR